MSCNGLNCDEKQSNPTTEGKQKFIKKVIKDHYVKFYEKKDVLELRSFNCPFKKLSNNATTWLKKDMTGEKL